LKSNGIIVVEYNETPVQGKHHKLLIEDYHIILDDNVVITVLMHQKLYKSEFKVYNSYFSHLYKRELFVSHLTQNNFGNLIHFDHCIITHTTFWKAVKASSSEFNRAKHHLVRFTNSKFTKNHVESALIDIASNIIDVEIKNCIFQNNKYDQLISSHTYSHGPTKLLISNTSFSVIKSERSLIEVSSAFVQLEGPVIFARLEIAQHSAVISVCRKYSKVLFQNYIEFSKLKFDEGAFIASTCPHTFNENRDRYIAIEENTLVNITKNTYQPLELFDKIKYTFYPPCYFQFISKSNLDSDFVQSGLPLNYSIIISDDNALEFLQHVMIHCYWLRRTAFITTNPFDVYKKFISPSHPPTH